MFMGNKYNHIGVWYSGNCSTKTYESSGVGEVWKKRRKRMKGPGAVGGAGGKKKRKGRIPVGDKEPSNRKRFRERKSPKVR